MRRENIYLKQRVSELESLLGHEHVETSSSTSERSTETVDFTQIELPLKGTPFWEVAHTVNKGRAENATSKDSYQLQIVHLSAEMAPIAKVGGLGDVVTGLARSCTARGHNVEVIIPFYECIDESLLEHLKLDFEFDCPKGQVWDGQYTIDHIQTQVFTANVEGCKVILLRPDWNQSNVFRGGQVYGGSYNETEAYLYFCRAALECLLVSGRQPDIIHLHEWQTSAAAMLFWEIYQKNGLVKSRVVLTIHNMDNTGECREEEFSITGVEGTLFNTVEKALDERTIGHNPERLSLLKGGVVYSNAVTTVSPTYADETSAGHGAGWLSGTLSMYSSKYFGILNGIDDVMWDPESDKCLPVSFSEDSLDGKHFLQSYVRSGLGLHIPKEKDRVPLVVCITRLVPQKGIHLIRHAIFRTLEQGGQFVLLGSGHVDGDFQNLAANEFKDSTNARLMVTYSESLSHYLFAAADIVLVPSIFEPCGLTQMIGMRYGAVPVVRQTGGLADTVKDVDDDSLPSQMQNGFMFGGADEASVNTALDRAIKYFKDRPLWWEALSIKS